VSASRSGWTSGLQHVDQVFEILRSHDEVRTRPEASDRSEVSAAGKIAMVLLVAALSIKSTRREVGEARPGASKLTPGDAQGRLAVSLKVSSTCRRQQVAKPFNEALGRGGDWARCVVLGTTNWNDDLSRNILDRLEGVDTQRTGDGAAERATALPTPGSREAKSLFTVTSRLVSPIDRACRLLACNAVVQLIQRLDRAAGPSPKVTLTAAPPLKELKVKACR